MELTKEIQEFLHNDALDRFLQYVKIWTTSDETKDVVPTSKNQLDLGKLLAKELNELGLEDIIHDEFGFVYAFLPASKGFEDVQPIGLLAHLDTSPAVTGKNVKPVIHKNYNGNDIKFKQDKELILNVNDTPHLRNYIGLDIITSEGDTLLGADNKAGVAEIMAACAAFTKFLELKHGPLVICFTPDEETGMGISKVDNTRLPEICYTVDGGKLGELEYECFDAWRAEYRFQGLSVHPGYAKDKMINSIQMASMFFSDFPELETPEHTEEREGYYHLTKMEGSAEKTTARMIIRDFDIKENQKRIDFITNLKTKYETRYPGLKIEVNFTHQYQNMLKFIEKNPRIVNLAEKAIKKAGIEVEIRPIRGGTDGARLSANGILTPNLFSGGSLHHSRKEHIPTLALQKAAEVLIYLAELWTKE
ncbi:MAG: peptidase T [Candidatus Thorarchaeota archaeon]